MQRLSTALKGLENNASSSLYVHIPFCNSKCSYCDFFSVTVHSLIDAEVERTIRQTSDYIDFFGIKRIPTVYIGGGTPTSVPMHILHKLLSYIKTLPLEQDAEITIEANPETVTKELLVMLSSSCVNRLSLGIQSFNQRTLSTLGRHCTASDSIKALELIKTEWKKSLSLELIASVPEQSFGDVASDIDKAVSFSPDHISLYSLTIEDGTPIAKKYASSSPLIDENVWIQAVDYLECKGYVRYEISNFAKPGYQSKHNVRYWRMQPYIGTGAGGVSTLHDGNGGFFRIANIHNIRSYVENSDILCSAGIESVVGKSADFERIMMGFRMVCGVDKNAFKALIPRTWQTWLSKGLAVEDESTMRLNREGLLLLNQFLLDALTELDL